MKTAHQEGVARLYAEDSQGRVILSFKAYLTDAELRQVAQELKRLSVTGYLRSYQAGFMRGEPIQDRLMPDGEQVLRYVGGLAQAFEAAQGGRPRKPWLGGYTGPDGASLPEDWDPRPDAPASRKEFLKAYLEAALWSSTDEDGTPMEREFSIEDIAPSAIAEATKESNRFIAKNMQDLELVGDWAQHGHDFWLTRNRHGAGFWDRGYSHVGDRLTESAHGFGETDLYRGDDGKLYFS